MRQLLISDGATASYSGGLLAAGAIDVQGLSSAGPTSLAPGETISDYAAIRIVQGTASHNIVSPWIDGTSVTNWAGQSYAAQQPQTTTVTFATGASAAFDATLKLVSRTPGQAQFERKSYTFSAGATATNAQVATGIFDLMNGNLPDFIESVADSGAGVLTIVGKTFDSDPYTLLSSFETVLQNLDGTYGTTGTVAVNATTGTPDLGNGGDGNLIVELEKSLQGMGRGFYNRVELPNTPTAYAVAATTYDLYKLRFGNASEGNIRGVDNYREIIVASPAGDADGAVFENKINPWLASCPGAFGAVNL